MKLARRITPIRIILPSMAWAISVVLLILFHGSSYSFGGEESTLRQLHILSLLTDNISDKTPNQYLCVNISYDRELVDLYDEYGFRKGNTDITSRKSIVRFLDVIQSVDYKAVVLDVLLDLRSDSETDSLLYSRLRGMPRLYMAFIPGSRINEHVDSAKLVQSSYSVNFNEGNFVKYLYEYDTFPYQSIALGVGENIYGSRKGSSRKAAILPIVYQIDRQYAESGEANWYNLGEDLLYGMATDELQELCRGKIIIIGDYEDRDIHDTYVGALSGPVIVLNAIESYGKGICNYGYFSLVMISLLLGLICFSITFNTNDIFEKYFQKKWIKLLMGVVSISLILLIIQIIEFYFSYHFHDFTGIVLWLSVYYWICQKLNSKYVVKQ